MVATPTTAPARTVIAHPRPQEDDRDQITTERWKPKDRRTSQQHLEYVQHGTWPEGDEFLELKAKVPADAGLEDDASTSSKPLTEQSVQDHLDAY